MKVEIISKTADALETICTFGKNCYSEEGIISLKEFYLNDVETETMDELDSPEKFAQYEGHKKDKMIAFVKGLIKTRHYTPIETVQINFAITGVSRALMAQITRHRIATFCIKSQRYVKESGFDYVTPNSIVKHQKERSEINYTGSLQDYYNWLMDEIGAFYDIAVKSNIPPEDARFVLPNACTTSIGVSFNLRSLMHFMELRLCSHAQWEIRELAGLMRKEVVESYPWMAEFLQPQCVLNKRCTEKKPCDMLKNGGIR